MENENLNILYKLILYTTDLDALPKVTTPKVYHKNSYHKNGLFSLQKFGPVKDWTCQCGIKNESGGVCDMCGVKHITSDSRRTQKATVKLIKEFMNPLFIWMYNLSNKGRSKNKILRNVYHMIFYLSYGIPWPNDPMDLELISYNLVPEKTCIGALEKERYIGARGAYTYLENIINADPTIIKKNSFLRFFQQHKGLFLIKKMIILPPGLRPDMEINNSKVINILNKKYTHILNRLSEIKKNTAMFLNDILINDLRGLQQDLIDVYDMIADKLSGKKGMIRGRMLGKRIDWSGRAVITPDPTLGLEQVRLPYFMLLELFKYHLAAKISIKDGNRMFFHEIVETIETMIRDETVNKEYMKDLEKVIDGKYCILNRQPTLHKHGILAFRIYISPDKTIKLNCLAYTPFNADNDGDQMAVYIPITDEAQLEAKTKINVLSNMLLDVNDEIAYPPSQDMVYGLYVASKYEKYNHFIPKYIKEIFDGKEMNKNNIIQVINKHYKIKPEETIKMLNDMKHVGFTVSTIANDPITLEDLYECSLSVEEIERDYYNTGNIEQDMIQEEKLNKRIYKLFKQIDYILSGARGSVEQLKQIIIARGYVADCNDDVIASAVKNNLMNGLTPEEFMISAYGARKGMVDIADSTAISGALCRNLVYACINAVLDPTTKDCGTTKYFKFHVKNRGVSNLLTGRWMNFKGKIIKINASVAIAIIGKTIFLRSPIGCKNEKFCHTCAPYKNIMYALVGALIFGEITTQTVLRTFHFSGNAKISSISKPTISTVKSTPKNKTRIKTKQKTGDQKNEDIIADLGNISSLFSQPTKYELTGYESTNTYFYKLYEKFAKHKPVKPIFFEFIISQLLWTDNLEKLYRLSNYEEGCSAVSINKVPILSSWLTGIAHNNFKRKLLKSIGSQNKDTIFDKIILDALKYE